MSGDMPPNTSSHSTPRTSESGESMTRVRWGVALLLFCVTTLNYGNRATLAMAGPVIAESLHMDPLAMGHIFAAFSWAYVIGQIPGGWLLDRYGSRRVYFGSIVCWSVFTLAQGAVVFFSGTAAFMVLYVLCFLVGLASAPSFPGNSRMAAAWFPVSERATAVTGINSAQYFATVLFAPLMALCIQYLTWPSAFVVMGVLGTAAGAWWLHTAIPPVLHPRMNAAELQHIRRGGALVTLDVPTGGLRDAAQASPENVTRSAASTSARRIRPLEGLRVLLSSRMMLGVYVAQYCVCALSSFYVTWFPVYLMDTRGVSLVAAGLFAMSPALCGGIGSILGGMSSDWLMRRTGSLTLARRLPSVLGLGMSMILVACVWIDSVVGVVVCMSLALLGKGIGSLGWTVLADTAPRQITGFAGGVFNMFGNLAGVVTPIVVGFIVYRTGAYDGALVFVAGHAVLGALCYLLVVTHIQRIEIA